MRVCIVLPEYTVLMSIYHGERKEFFEQSLTSILEQTLCPTEIVLVCDGELGKELETTIVEFEQRVPSLLYVVRLKENVGLGQALNIGLQHCSCDYVARMDSDDVSAPNRCEKQLRWMHENGLDLCGTNVLEFTDNPANSNGKRVVPSTHGEIVQYAKSRNPFNHPSVMFKKTMVEQAGGYQDMPYFEDYYLWIRMLRLNAVTANLPEILLYMRSGSNFYRRRGGVNYIRCIGRFWNRVCALGFVTRGQASKNVVVRTAVSLLPNCARTTFYNRKLRSK